MNRILMKILFCPKIGKVDQKWCFFHFLKNSVISFPGINLNKKSYCYLYFTANPLSGKILVLKLWAKMLSANQIAGFF